MVALVEASAAIAIVMGPILNAWLSRSSNTCVCHEWHRGGSHEMTQELPGSNKSAWR